MDECEKTILVWAGKAVKWTWTPIFVLTRAKVDDWRIALAFVFCSLRLFLVAWADDVKTRWATWHTENSAQDGVGF